MKDMFWNSSAIDKLRAINRGNAKLSISVLGSSSVGKTALTVRYLTGRFIGDYCSGQDMAYRTSVPHLGGSFSTPVDILDTSNLTLNGPSYPTSCTSFSNSPLSKPKKSSHHYQAYLVVYSLTDATSFKLAKEILTSLPSTAPKFLAANQLDLQHRRQVSREDGQALADRFDRCHFGEFSAADPLADRHHSGHIKSAFGKLIRQLIFSSPQCVLAPYCPRISFSVFSKLLSTLAVVKTRNKQRGMTRSIGGGGSVDSESSSCSSSSARSIRSCSPVASSSTFNLISSDDGLMLPLVGRRPQNNNIKEQVILPISILLHHLHLSEGMLDDDFPSGYPPTNLMTSST